MTARPGYISDAPLGMTPRMLDYLRLAAEGATNEETARALWVSFEGVKSARRQILLRTGARNITHAVALAYEEGLLP